ncbi:hypothetical protein [Actinophytocola glycyrrhizae]|uniref:LigA protein n=1 Tax=Actinophytocola glycyrrhizae TaxID=2044873 RepID=A0ABV9SAG8_9PSEU
MDTREFADALREATADRVPREGFAEAVLSGSRRRRTRNRLTATAAVTGVAAAVAAVVLTVPSQSSLPPGDSTAVTSPPKQDLRLTRSGGELIGDADLTGRAVDAWNAGMAGAPVNPDGALDDRLGEPHVYWAGDTPVGDTVIVMQIVRLPADERVPPEERGQEVLVTGIVATAPGTDELRLLGAQDDPRAGQFLLPDDRTVLAVTYAGMSGTEYENIGLWASPEIRYAEDGTAGRDWIPVAIDDGVGIGTLPSGTNPLNVRLVTGQEAPSARVEQKTGAHLPLLRTATYPEPAPSPQPHGLEWEGTLAVGEPRDLAPPPSDIFVTAIRDDGILDSASYTEQQAKWTVVAGTAGDATVILGEHQELDHPAYLYAVTLGPDERTVAGVERVAEIDRDHALPVAYQLPDAQGTVIAAQGKSLSYRASADAAWSTPVDDAALVPADATQVRVGNEVIDL